MVEFWNNLKDWQKGGIIGFIVGIIFVIYTTLNSKSPHSYEFILLNFFSTILPAIYGTLNGYIYSKVKNLTSVKKWIIFLISLLITGIVIFFIGWVLLINIAKPY